LSSTNLQYTFYVAYILIYFEVALKNYSILPGILSEENAREFSGNFLTRFHLVSN